MNASRLRHPNTLMHVSNKEKIMTTSTLSTAARGSYPPSDARPAEASGTFLIGDIPVHRLGFGAMQLTGDGVWGEPDDHSEAIAVLRHAVELGIDLIDTADSYGPEVSERLIAEALHPYPADLLIATHAGFQRSGPNQWVEDGRPEHLRSAVEGSLRRLRLERIDLLQLHRIDPKVAMEDQMAHWSIFSARARFATSDCLKSALSKSKQSGGSRRSFRSRIDITWSIEVPRTCWNIARAKVLASSHGFRSRPANSPNMTVR
jgi:hypothetical protein